MAEFPRRLAPATLRLKELIATRLGKPKLLFCHRRSSIEPGGSPRRPTRHCPTMQREMIEQVDWCRYVAGLEPTSVVGIEHCCIGTQRRRRLPDDEPRFFAARRTRQRPGRADQLRPLHADRLARSGCPFARRPPCRSAASGAWRSSICRRR